MKKIVLSMLVAVTTLSSCSAVKITVEKPSQKSDEPVTEYVQDSSQLYIDEEHGYIPLNYDQQTGQWFPYMHFDEYMYGKSEKEFRSAVHEMFSQARASSINTVYLHVHPCGDAYYKSDIFPLGTYLDGDYDPLEIMLQEGHALGLSVHAWLNPLRCQTIEQMNELPDDFIVKQWADDPDCHFVEAVNDRWYLNPAYDETIELICGCVDEILDNYDVDGIHIDDYFYPTTAVEFDSIAFENSGSSDLSKWRTENCSKFVKAIYDTVKKHDSKILFGISPQGNVSANYETQYADVKLWCSQDGYCDYIVPQIYFGFRNETCPFERTLTEWEAIVKNENISLIIGLGAYKLGNEDIWAGEAGEYEWIENPLIIQQQTELVLESSAKGYALYY